MLFLTKSKNLSSFKQAQIKAVKTTLVLMNFCEGSVPDSSPADVVLDADRTWAAAQRNNMETGMMPVEAGWKAKGLILGKLGGSGWQLLLFSIAKPSVTSQ